MAALELQIPAAAAAVVDRNSPLVLEMALQAALELSWFNMLTHFELRLLLDLRPIQSLAVFALIVSQEAGASHSDGTLCKN